MPQLCAIHRIIVCLVFSYCTIKLYFKIPRSYICFGLTLFNAVVPGEGTWGGEVGSGTQLPDGGGGGIERFERIENFSTPN